jgi:predicted transcriptional regulator
MTELVRHLIRLGLNEYEAKAYIATVALGEGTVKEISEKSGVPRSRTYDVMSRLADKGLVEEGTSAPKCYRANEPMIASHHLMEEIRHANEEILKELNEIGKRSGKHDNPIWTLKGEWAIDHKIDEMLVAAKEEVYLVFFNNKNVIRYAKTLSRLSENKRITVVICNDPESFVGMLGRTKIMKWGLGLGNPKNMEGAITEKGYTTKGGAYCIELLLQCDHEDTLVLTKEEDGHHALIISGTILNFFSHESVQLIIDSANELGIENSERHKKEQTSVFDNRVVFPKW